MNELRLYEEIGFDGITVEAFARQLQACRDPVTVHVNCPGGSVVEGIAIYESLRRRQVCVVIDGLAASMGSVVAMAGRPVKASRGALLMVHNPWVTATGDADKLRKQAEVLDRVANSILNAYVGKTGRPGAEIREWMAGERWFTAEEAKAVGLVDEILDTPMANMTRFEGRLAGLATRVKAQQAVVDTALGQLRARLATESDPDVRVTLARQLRQARGHGDLFS